MSSGPQAIALAGTTIVDGTGGPPAAGTTLLLRGDRIVDVFPAGSKELGADVTLLDLGGLYVTPGFVESHCHVAGLIAMAPGELGLAGDVMPILPRYGITAVRDTGGPDTDVTWQPMKQGRDDWPRFFGSGPVIDGWPGDRSRASGRRPTSRRRGTGCGSSRGLVSTSSRPTSGSVAT